MKRRSPTIRRAFPVHGPAGSLEAILEGAGDSPVFRAVFAHPHPKYGGTMQTNAVVHACRVLVELGGLVLRFNFRGVGKSAGEYDEGRGEAQDLAAAVRAAFQLAPATAPCLIGGFSFGSIRAMEIAALGLGDVWLGLAPPITLEKYADLKVVPVPAAIVLAGADELVPKPSDELLNKHFPDLRTVQVVANAAHLFTGCYDDLRRSVAVAARALFPELALRESSR